jgi:hypothetical protein
MPQLRCSRAHIFACWRLSDKRLVVATQRLIKMRAPPTPTPSPGTTVNDDLRRVCLPTAKCKLKTLDEWIDRSVKLLLAFASRVIPGFRVLEIHDQDFYSLLKYVCISKSGLLFDEGGVSYSMQALRFWHHIFSTSIHTLSRRPGHYGLCASFVTVLY